MRAFVATDIPKEVKEQIILIQKKLQEFKGKLTEPENLHLTLKFLGEINENQIEQVKLRLRKVNSKIFETSIDSLGWFDNRKSNRYEQQIVIWLHMKNCDKLQKKVDTGLKDIFPMERRFMSHLTIARIRSLDNKKDFLEKLSRIKLKQTDFRINKFKLKGSKLNKNGPSYYDLETYKLQ